MAADTVRDLKLGADGDFAISGGDLVLISGLEAIAQSVRIRLQFFRGEWYLNTEAGVPWFQSVLVKNPDAVLLRTIFRDAIAETPGILAVVELSLSFDARARRLAVRYRATTDLGELDRTEEV